MPFKGLFLSCNARCEIPNLSKHHLFGPKSTVWNLKTKAALYESHLMQCISREIPLSKLLVFVSFVATHQVQHRPRRQGGSTLKFSLKMRPNLTRLYPQTGKKLGKQRTFCQVAPPQFFRAPTPMRPIVLNQNSDWNFLALNSCFQRCVTTIKLMREVNEKAWYAYWWVVINKYLHRSVFISTYKFHISSYMVGNTALLISLKYISYIQYFLIIL